MVRVHTEPYYPRRRKVNRTFVTCLGPHIGSHIVCVCVCVRERESEKREEIAVDCFFYRTLLSQSSPHTHTHTHTHRAVFFYEFSLGYLVITSVISGGSDIGCYYVRRALAAAGERSLLEICGVAISIRLTTTISTTHRTCNRADAWVVGVVTLHHTRCFTAATP